MTAANTASPATARLTVTERMARLLGAIPWIVEQGGASLDELAARFDYPVEQLLQDLTQRVFFVGVHPFTPDTLIEVEITDGVVDIRYADWFSQPMQLRSEEATRLLAAGRTVLEMTQDGSNLGSHSDAAEPLVRALTKLSLSLGSDNTDSSDNADSGNVATIVDKIDVCLGHASRDTLNDLRSALSKQRAVTIDYYSQTRNVMTRRTVDPAQLFSSEGAWYLYGWCRHVDAERVFRVDRIRDLEVLDEAAKADIAPSRTPTTVSLDDVDRSVTLRLSPEVAWAADYYPVRQQAVDDDGSVEAEFAVASESWLARLLLQLGPHAELIDSQGNIDTDLRASAAAQVLSRYSQ